MTAQVRAAVVGVGAFGRHHARIYHELAPEGVELVGLVDIDPVGPEAIAAEYRVPLVRAIDELPTRPDVVSVAVPTTAHRSVAEPLLRQGVHCLVEKPVSGSSADARCLVEAALAGSAHLQVGLVERFNPVVSALDRLGEPPVYVEMHRLTPWTGRATDVGVVLDMMIHDLDLLGRIVGEEACDVQAVGISILSAHEDVVNARITFPSGCVANVTASRVAEERMRQVRVFGRRACLRMDFDQREASLVRYRRRARALGNKLRGLAARGAHLDGGRAPGRPVPLEGRLEAERVPITDAEPLRAEILALLGAVRTGSRPPVGGPEGLRALRLAEAVLEGVRRTEGPMLPLGS